MGRIEAIWIKRAKKGPMDAVTGAVLRAGCGLEGNADQGGRRQVTLLDAARWGRVERDLGRAVDPALRRANVLLSGIPLEETRGRILRLGGCRVRILGETRPCELMDRQSPGLRAALEDAWGGGAFGEVLGGGPVSVGDEASLEVEGEHPMSAEEHARSVFREVPYMGVIHVVAEAMKLGFRNGHPDWSNLGQGQPEVGEMDGAPPRIREVTVEPSDQAYGPLEGIPELREAVAAHYNRLYRRGHGSQYTASNVAIAAGGRVALARVFAALGNVNLAYQIPDYTAYEDLITYHEQRFTPVVLPTRAEDGFRVPPDVLEKEVVRHGLSAFVLSNPCNPTGAVVRDAELEAYVRIARDRGCALLLDEFYSHFVYTPEGGPAGGPVSAAAFVEDVDRDPVLLVDGLTKSFRYPGWRLGWAVGPPQMVETMARTGSAIDGGPSCMVQRAALKALEPRQADAETSALRRVFARKRNLMVERLLGMGIRCAREPEGTFYVWASVADLPPPLEDGEAFFQAALPRKVLTVPGAYFDVNPGKRRPGPSPYRQWVRFSFGPPEDNMMMGLDRLEELVRDHS